MSKVAIVFEASREGYGIDQLFDGHYAKPMTVGYLREILENLPDDMLFVLSHDRGYTYGSINETYSSFAIEVDERMWVREDDLQTVMDAYEFGYEDEEKY